MANGTATQSSRPAPTGNYPKSKLLVISFRTNCLRISFSVSCADHLGSTIIFSFTFLSQNGIILEFHLYFFFKALFALDPSEHGRRLFSSQANGLDTAMEKPHTLEEYSVDHFRPPPKRGTMSKSLTLREGLIHI
jgi:hypothetical protein